MKDVFAKILSEYQDAKKEKFGGHPLAKFVREAAVNTMISEASIETDVYKVAGSPGQGAWAQIPWLSVLDKSVTPTPTHGYDIIYLFRADMSGVYLSLNQGWTYFKNTYGPKRGGKYIEEIAKYWREELSSSLSDFETEEINLMAGDKGLPRGYELGHICGVFYPADNLPDAAKMTSDLRNFIGVFRELKGKIGTQGFDKKNAEIIANSLIDSEAGSENNELLITESNSKKETDAGGGALDDRLNERVLAGVPAGLKLQEPPASLRPVQKVRERVARKIDFESKQRRQKKIGLLGEEAVVAYERQRLTMANRPDLAQKVVHESSEHGDGSGYDVLSFTVEGEKLFIEVKATTGSIQERFFLSSNEVDFSRENADNYALYRVYDLSVDTDDWGLYVIYGSIEDTLELAPTSFLASGLISAKS